MRRLLWLLLAWWVTIWLAVGCSTSAPANPAATAIDDRGQTVGGPSFEAAAPLPRETAAGGWKFDLQPGATRYFRLDIERPMQVMIQFAANESLVEIEMYDAQQRPFQWSATAKPRLEKTARVGHSRLLTGRLAEEHLEQIACDYLAPGTYYVSIRNRDTVKNCPAALEIKVAPSTWAPPTDWEPR